MNNFYELLQLMQKQFAASPHKLIPISSEVMVGELSQAVAAFNASQRRMELNTFADVCCTGGELSIILLTEEELPKRKLRTLPGIH